MSLCYITAPRNAFVREKYSFASLRQYRSTGLGDTGKVVSELFAILLERKKSLQEEERIETYSLDLLPLSLFVLTMVIKKKKKLSPAIKN